MDDVRIELLYDVGVALEAFEQGGSENAAALITAFTRLWNAFQRLVDTREMKNVEATFSSVRDQLIREQAVLNGALQVLTQSMSISTTSTTGFEFVESTLVQAVRKGDWVLLDNLSAAPSDVIERILSLAESPQKLHLFESPQNEKLCTGNGISSGFRLFATVNPTRHTQTQLSSAFLNRVISVHLPEVDYDALTKFQQSREAPLADTELYKIIVSQMQSVTACRALTKTLVKMHCELRDRWFRGDLKTVGNVQLTFRTALRTSQQIVYMNRLGIHPVKALVTAVGQHYVKCCRLEDQWNVLALLGQELECKRTGADLQHLLQRNDRWLSESQSVMEMLLPNIQTTLANLVGFVLECLCYHLKVLENDRSGQDYVSSAVHAISRATDNLLTQISTTNQLINSLTTLRSRCDLMKSKGQSLAFSKLIEAVEQYVKTYEETSLSTLSYTVKDASELASAAESVRADLYAMGIEIETCIVKSSFEDALRHLNITGKVVSTMRSVHETIDQHSWLSVYSLQLCERNRGSATAMQEGLENVRNAMSVCYQHATVVDCVKKPLQLLNLAVGNLQRDFGSHATKSATILTTVHRILRERIVINCDRDRLLEFLNNYKLLPTQNVARLKLLLYAIEMLFLLSSSVPLALREVSNVESTYLVEKLQELSLLECGIDICKRVESLLSDSLVPVLKKRASIRNAKSKLERDEMLRCTDEDVSSNEIAVERDQHDLEKLRLVFEEQRMSFVESEDTRFVRMWYSEAIRKIHCRIFRWLAAEKQSIETDSDEFRRLLLHLQPRELNLSLGPLWIVVFSELCEFMWSSTSSWDVYLISSESDLERELSKRSLPNALVFVAEEDLYYPFGVVILNTVKNMVYVLSLERRSKTSRSNTLLDRVVATFEDHSPGSSTMQVIDINVSTESSVSQLTHLASLLPAIALTKISFTSPELEIALIQQEVTSFEKKLSGYYQRLSTVLERSTSEVTVRHYVLQVVTVVNDLSEGVFGNLNTSMTDTNNDGEKDCKSLESRVVQIKRSLERQLDGFVNSFIPRDVQKCFQVLTKVELAISTQLACSSRSDIENERLPRDLRLLKMLQDYGKQNTNSKELTQWGLMWHVVRKMLAAVEILVDDTFLATGSRSTNWRLSEDFYADLQFCLVFGDCNDALSCICAKFQNIQSHFSNAMKSICDFGEEDYSVYSNKLFQSHLQQAVTVVESLGEFLYVTGLEQSSKRRETYFELTEAVTACCNPNLEEKICDSESVKESYQKILDKALEQFIQKLTEMYNEVWEIVDVGSPLVLSMMLDIRNSESILAALRQGEDSPDINNIARPNILHSRICHYRNEIDMLLKSNRTENDELLSVVSKEIMQKKPEDIAESPSAATLTSNDCKRTEELSDLQETCNQTLSLCKADDFVEIEMMNKKFNYLVSFWFVQSCWERIYMESKQLHNDLGHVYGRDDKALLKKQVDIANMISHVDKERQHSSIVRKLLSHTSLSSRGTKDVVTSVLQTLLKKRWQFCCSVGTNCKDGLYGCRLLKDVCSSVARNPLAQQKSKLVNAKQILDLCLSRSKVLKSQKGVFDDDTVTRLRPYSVMMTDLHFMLMATDVDGCEYFLECEMELERELFVPGRCDLTRPSYLAPESEEAEFGMIRPVTILLDELTSERQCWVGQLREFHSESMHLFVNAFNKFFQDQNVGVAAVIRRSYRSLSELPEYSLLVSTTGVCDCLWILQNVLIELQENGELELTSFFLLRKDNELTEQAKQTLETEIRRHSKEGEHHSTEQREAQFFSGTDDTKKQTVGVMKEDVAARVKGLLPDLIRTNRWHHIRDALRDITNHLTVFKDTCSDYLTNLCRKYDSVSNTDGAKRLDTKSLSSNIALTDTLLNSALKYTHARRQDRDVLKGSSQVQDVKWNSNCDAKNVQQALSKVSNFCYKTFSNEQESPEFCKKFQNLIQFLTCCVQSLCASVDDIDLKMEGLTKYHSGNVLEELCSTSEKFGDNVKEVFHELSRQCSLSVASSLVVSRKGQVALELAAQFREEAFTVRTFSSSLEGHYLHCVSLMLKFVTIVLLIVERRQKGSCDIDQLRRCLKRHGPLIADKYCGKDLKVEFKMVCNEMQSAQRQLHRPLEMLLLDFVGDPFVATSMDARVAEWLQRGVSDTCVIGEGIGKNLKWFMSIPDLRRRELQHVGSALSKLASVMQQKLDVLDDFGGIETNSLKNSYTLLETIHQLFIEFEVRKNVQTPSNVLLANGTLLVRQLHCSTLDAVFGRLMQASCSTAVMDNHAVCIMQFLDSAYTTYQVEGSEVLETESVNVMHLVISFLFEGILTTGRVLRKHLIELPYCHGLAFDFPSFLQQFAKIVKNFQAMLNWPVTTIDVTDTLELEKSHVVMTEARVKDAVYEMSSFLLKYDNLIWTMMRDTTISWLRKVTGSSCTGAKEIVSVKNSLADLEHRWKTDLTIIVDTVNSERKKMKGTSILKRVLGAPAKLVKSLMGTTADVQRKLKSYLDLKASIEDNLTSAFHEVAILLRHHPNTSDKIHADVIYQLLSGVEKYNNELLEKEGERADLFYIGETLKASLKMIHVDALVLTSKQTFVSLCLEDNQNCYSDSLSHESCQLSISVPIEQLHLVLFRFVVGEKKYSSARILRTLTDSIRNVSTPQQKTVEFTEEFENGFRVTTTLRCKYEFCLETTGDTAVGSHQNDCYLLCCKRAREITSSACHLIYTEKWSNYSQINKVICSDAERLHEVENDTLKKWDLNQTAGGGAKACFVDLVNRASLARTNATRIVNDLEGKSFSEIEECCKTMSELLSAKIESDIEMCRSHLTVLTEWKVPHCQSYFPKRRPPTNLSACSTSLSVVCQEALALATNDLCTAKTVQSGLVLLAILSAESDKNEQFRNLERICQNLETPKWLTELFRNRESSLQSSVVLSGDLRKQATYILRKRSSCCSKLCDKFVFSHRPAMFTQEVKNELISSCRLEPALHFFQDGSVLKPSLNFFSLNLSSVVSETWNPTSTITLFNHSSIRSAQFQFESKTNKNAFCVDPVSGEIKPNSSCQVLVSFDKSHLTAGRNSAVYASSWFVISIRSQPFSLNGSMDSYVEELNGQVFAFVVGELQPIDTCLNVSPLCIDFGAISAGLGGGTHTKFAVVRNNSDHNVTAIAKLQGSDTESAKIVCKIGTDKMHTLKPTEDFSWSIEPLSFTAVTVDCIPLDKPGKVDAKLTFKFPSGKVIETPIRGVIVNPQLTLTIDGIRKQIGEHTSGNNKCIQFSIDEQKTQETVRVENRGLVSCKLSEVMLLLPRTFHKIPAASTLLLPRTSILLTFEKSLLPMKFYCGGKEVNLVKTSANSFSNFSSVPVRIYGTNNVTIVSLSEGVRQSGLWSIKEVNGNELKLLSQIPIKFQLQLTGMASCRTNVTCSNSRVSLKPSIISLATPKRNQDITCLYCPVTSLDRFNIDISYTTKSMSGPRESFSAPHVVRTSETVQTKFTFWLQDNQPVSKHFFCEQLQEGKMSEVDIDITIAGGKGVRRSLNYEVSAKSVNCSSKWQASKPKEWHNCSDRRSEKLPEKAEKRKIGITKEITEDFGVCGCEIHLKCSDSLKVWCGEVVPYSTKLYFFDQNVERQEQEYHLNEDKEVAVIGMVADALHLVQRKESFRVAAIAVMKAIICQEDETSESETENEANLISRLVDAAEDVTATSISDILLNSKYCSLEGSVLKACQHGLLACKLATMCKLNSVKVYFPNSKDLIDAIIECLILPQTDSLPYHWRALFTNLKALICLVDSVKLNCSKSKEPTGLSNFMKEVVKSCQQLPSQFIEINHVVSALLKVTDVVWCGDFNETSVHGIPKAAARLCVQQPKTLKQLFQSLKPVTDPETHGCTIYAALELAAQPCSVCTVCTYFRKSALKIMDVSSTADNITTILDSISKALNCCPVECLSVDGLLELLKDLLSAGGVVSLSNEVMEILSGFFGLLSAKEATVSKVVNVLSLLLNAAMFDDLPFLSGKLLPLLRKICTEDRSVTRTEGVADVISLYLEGKCGDDNSCSTAFNAIVTCLTSTSVNVNMVTSKLKNELGKLGVDPKGIRFRDLVTSARTIAETRTSSVQTVIPALFDVAEIFAEVFTENFSHQLANLELCLDWMISQSEVSHIYRIAAAFNVTQIIYTVCCGDAPLASRIAKRLKNLTKCFNRITNYVGHERLDTLSSEFDASDREEGQVATYSSRWSFSFDFFYLARRVFLLVVSKQKLNDTALQGSHRSIAAVNFPKLIANCFASPLSTLPDCLADVVVQVCGIKHEDNLRQTATHIRAVVEYQLELRYGLIKNLLGCNLQILSNTATLTADLETTLKILTRSVRPKLAAKLQCFEDKDSETACQLVKTALSTVEWCDVSLLSYFQFVNLLDEQRQGNDVVVVRKLDDLLALSKARLPAERAKRARIDCKQILGILQAMVSEDFKEILNNLKTILSQESSDGSLSSATNVVKTVLKMASKNATPSVWNDVMLLFQALCQQKETSIKESIAQTWERQAKFDCLSKEFWEKLDCQYNDIRGSSDETIQSSWQHLYLFIKELDRSGIESDTCSHLAKILDMIFSSSMTNYANFRQLIDVMYCVEQFVQPANVAVGQFLCKVRSVFETVAVIFDSWMKNLEVLLTDEPKVFSSISRIVNDVTIEEGFQFSRALLNCTQLAIDGNLVSNSERQGKVNSVYTHIVNLFLRPLCSDADVGILSDTVLSLLDGTVDLQCKPGKKRLSFHLLSLLLEAIRTCWKFENCNNEDQLTCSMYGLSAASLVTLTKVAALATTEKPSPITDNAESNAESSDRNSMIGSSSSSSFETTRLSDRPSDKSEYDNENDMQSNDDISSLDELELNVDDYTDSETMSDDENADVSLSLASLEKGDEQQWNQEDGRSSGNLLQKQPSIDVGASEFVAIEDCILNFSDLDVKVSLCLPVPLVNEVKTLIS